MEDFQDYMISELKKRFEQLAAIDSWTLSWQDGRTQVELMMDLAETITRLERRQHHKHAHGRFGHKHAHHGCGKPEEKEAKPQPARFTHLEDHHPSKAFRPARNQNPADAQDTVIIIEEIDLD